MIHLSNDLILAEIHPKGAELQRLFHKRHGIEHMWNGDAAYWGKHSPVLFPIVGSLKEGHFIYDEKSYALPRHGFARDMEFTAAQLSETAAVFTLTHNEKTLSVYPFEFVLKLVYTLDEDVLTVEYFVENPADKPMYFSIGAHPAFAVPFNGGGYEDHYLEFDAPVTAGRYPLVDGGLVLPQDNPFLKAEKALPLSHALFSADAVVLRNIDINTVSLCNSNSSHGLQMRIQGWPDLGIWAAPNAPFVCIEPWCGHADLSNHNQQLVNKAGIIELSAGAAWQKSWQVQLF